jgi:hypothetical protein
MEQGRQGFQQDDVVDRTDLEEVLSRSEVRNVELIGYSDLDGRPAFKMAMQTVGERWYLYVGHLWHRGWSVLDVTNPYHPKVVKFWSGPDNTWTIQMQAAEGKLVTALERMLPRWGGRTDVPHAETAMFWDVAEPTEPKLLGTFSLGGTGSHRNFWAGGQYAYLAANPPGFTGNVPVVVDVSDPVNPREVGRFWIEGQAPDETIPPHEDGLSVHGPVYVVGERAYVSYGGAGMVILDVADPRNPKAISRFDVSPPFKGGFGGGGVHTVLPLLDRGLAVVNGECHAEYAREPLSFAGIVDIADEEHPKLVSMLPWPRPSQGLPYRNYADRGGKFGPHNTHLSHGNPCLEERSDLFYMTWEAAGLRIYDISDPRQPEEVGHFVAPDPTTRVGLLPEFALATQTEDVLVDARGFIYISDKNHGIFVLRYRPLA